MKRMKRMLKPTALRVRGESLEGVRLLEKRLLPAAFFNDSDPLDRWQ